MPINRKLFERLKPSFAYLEEYDRLHGRPDKRVPLCITVPLGLKQRLQESGRGNISRFVERALEEHLSEGRRSAHR